MGPLRADGGPTTSLGVTMTAEYLPDPIGPEALSEWLGESISEEEDQARARRVIAYAWTLVNSETEHDIAYWKGLERLPEDVENVVLQVAGRGYSNPESWGNERVDDWGGGGRPVEELGMYLTATETRILRRFAARAIVGFGVVGTYRDEPEDGFSPWANPVTGGIPDWGV